MMLEKDYIIGWSWKMSKQGNVKLKVIYLSTNITVNGSLLDIMRK